MKKILITMLLLSVFVVVSCDGGIKEDTDKDLGTTDTDVITDEEITDYEEDTDHDSPLTDDDFPVIDDDDPVTDDSLPVTDNDEEPDEEPDEFPDDSEEPDDAFNPEDCIDKFPHYHKGLCWSDRSASTMNWSNTNSYCKGLGGRLPNIQELRMLIKECPQNEYPQPEGQDAWCEIEDPDKSAWGDWSSDCKRCDSDSSGKYSVFGDTDWFWSSSSYVYVSPNDTWSVNFSNGSVDYAHKAYDGHARCVR